MNYISQRQVKPAGISPDLNAEYRVIVSYSETEARILAAFGFPPAD